MATEAQLRYVRILIEERNAPRPEAILAEVAAADTRRASQIIDVLKGLPYKRQNLRRPAQGEIEPGLYTLGDTIYEVRKSQRGRSYALEVREDGRREYAPGKVHMIKPENRLTLEEAKAYGRRTGYCCMCGKLLTNPESVDAGIGPICATKF